VSSIPGDRRLPTITASDLNGKEINLPQELPEGRTLLLIAFKREQQGDIDSWTTALKGNPIEWREIPVISNYGSIFRSFVDNGMRSGILTEQARAHVITLFTDPKLFRNSVGLGDGERIYAVVVDREGKVFGVAPGRFTPEALEKLLPSLNEVSGN